ncbi:MAG: uridine diphosphate-N-acetylglucosamine-binding protein YvcK [Acidimicrobiia bacterium]
MTSADANESEAVRAPRVVALGGGHGLATALRAVRRYAGDITAIVSVADDGGSSGRLRRDLGVPAPGDLRRCLVALAGDDHLWSEAFEYRFAGGELEGHALGNLVLVGLAETLGSFEAALDEAGRLLGAVGRVVPATSESVELKAEIGGSAPQDGGSPSTEVEGQVAVANSHDIRRVGLVPADAAAPPAAVAAIAAADQIVLAPGSLYTSILPVVCVPALREALAGASAPVVQVANLRPQLPETAGLDGTGHLAAVLDHGVRVDTFLYERAGVLTVDEDRVRAWGVEPVAGRMAAPNGHSHDPERLAGMLAALRR